MKTTDGWIEKMSEVEQALSREEGSFALFALLEREDTPGFWDVVASASWLKTDREGILTIAQQITSRLVKDQVVQIARIVPLLPDSDFVRFLQKVYAEMSVTGPQVRLGESVLSGVEIRSGYILAADTSHVRSKDMKVKMLSHA